MSSFGAGFLGGKMTDAMFELPDVENEGKFVVNERVGLSIGKCRHSILEAMLAID